MHKDNHTNQLQLSTHSIDVVDEETNRKWRIERIAQTPEQAEKYGEWGDLIMFTDFGPVDAPKERPQMVSKYYSKRLLVSKYTNSVDHGLDLMGHVPAWKVSAQVMDIARAMARWSMMKPERQRLGVA